MDHISSDLIPEILKFLPNRDVKQAILTSRRWLALSPLDQLKRRHYNSIKFFALTYHDFDFSRPIPRPIYPAPSAYEHLNDCLLKAIKLGHLIFLQWCYSEILKQPFRFTDNLESGKYVSKRLLEHFYESEYFDRAAINGHLSICQWLISIRPTGYSDPICTNLALNIASSHGHLPVVQWMTEQKIGQCTYIAMDDAIHNRHDHVVNYLYQYRQEGPSYSALTCCVNRKNIVNPRTEAEAIAQLKWLLTNYSHKFPLDSEFDTNLFYSAAQNNDYEILKFLYYNRNVQGWEGLLDKLAVRSNLEIIKFVHFNLQHPQLATSRAIDVALFNDNFDVAKFLYAARPEGFTHAALEYLVNKNNLTMLEWWLPKCPEPIDYRKLQSLAKSSTPILNYLRTKSGN